MVFTKKINVKKGQVNLNHTNLKDILQLCSPSEQFVLVEKYWLVSWKPTPMQQIWERFDMSRERIRQILNKSLQKVRRLINHDQSLLQLINLAHEIVRKNWYFIAEENLINQLRKASWTHFTYQELLLVLSADYDLYYLHRNKRFQKVFFIEPLFEDLLNDIHDTAYEFLKSTHKTLPFNELVSKLQSIFLQKFQRNQSIKELLLNDLLYKQIFILSRNIYLFDDKVGLEDNPEVNPKTIKLKIKYILSQEGQPLHYEKITEKIKEKFNVKKIKTTTVHNELVKNSEFVNVWMWTYWLKEWWYQWENTIETIKNILAKAWRPMKVSEITKEVLKERLIREITVLMVLQKHPEIFQRVWKWVYTLKK